MKYYVFKLFIKYFAKSNNQIKYHLLLQSKDGSTILFEISKHNIIYVLYL